MLDIISLQCWVLRGENNRPDFSPVTDFLNELEEAQQNGLGEHHS